MRVPGEGELEALLAAGRGEDLVAVRGQDGGDRCGEVAVVVYHQYPETFVRHPLLPLRAGRRACQRTSSARARILSAQLGKRIRRTLPGGVPGR